MFIIIAIDFTDWTGRNWKKGQRPFVSFNLAMQWILEGRAIDPDNPPTPEELEEKQVRSGLIKKKKVIDKSKKDKK